MFSTRIRGCFLTYKMWRKCSGSKENSFLVILTRISTIALLNLKYTSSVVTFPLKRIYRGCQVDTAQEFKTDLLRRPTILAGKCLKYEPGIK